MPEVQGDEGGGGAIPPPPSSPSFPPPPPTSSGPTSAPPVPPPTADDGTVITLDAADTVAPSKAWSDFRAYLTGQRNTGVDLPDKQLAILRHGRRLPRPLASDLWRRRSQ